MNAVNYTTMFNHLHRITVILNLPVHTNNNNKKWKWKIDIRKDVTYEDTLTDFFLVKLYKKAKDAC